MGTLKLNGIPPEFEYQKSLDTVQKRHHVRLWKEPQRADVWLGTATEDIAFRFEMTHWTHSSNPKIDNERAKVINDLAFTGCVDAAGLLMRNLQDLRQDPKAAPSIVTDGRILVLRLNECRSPNTMVGIDLASPARPRGQLSRALLSFRKGVVSSSRIPFTTCNTLKSLTERRASPQAREVPSVATPQRRLDWLSSLAPPSSGQP